MLEKEPAVANAEYLYYGCPNSLVYDDPDYAEDMGEDVMAILYPEGADFGELFERYAYKNLPRETQDLVNTLWEQLKIN